jgi:hypothetical protein
MMAEAGGERYEEFLNRVTESADRRARQGRSLLEEIERRRGEAREQGRHFTAPTEEQLLTKLRKMNSPMIVFQSWNGSTTTPGTINYTVGINNPDPTTAIWLFVHLFIGPANIAPDANDALALVDTRFPRLTEPEFFGLSIDAGNTASLNFSISVPGNLEPSNYMGNSFLFAATWHDPGNYLDRSLFIFKVT